MRLTEALAKVLYQRAIDTNKTEQLTQAFDRHLGLKGRFKQVQLANSDKKAWKRLALKGYECYAFSKPLSASGTFPEETAIERVMHEVWPSRVDTEPPASIPGQTVPQTSTAGRGKGRATAGGSVARSKQTPKAVQAEACVDSGTGDKRYMSAQQEARFIELSCHLWRKFHVFTKQLRCKNPQDSSLLDFGKNSRDLGARWCMFLPRNRCSALYLHTVMMHGDDFMKYLLARNLTIGMLENSGAERRHLIGKVMFIKSLGGGGSLYFQLSGTEARSAYLTFRGLLIWQNGRDFLAYLMADEKRKAENAVEQGGKRRMGWDSVGDPTVPETARTKISDLLYHECKELDAADVLSDQILEALEETDDSRPPVVDLDSDSIAKSCEGYTDPEQPFFHPDGRYIADLDGARLDGSDSEYGSESDSDLGESCSEDDGESGEDSPDDDAF